MPEQYEEASGRYWPWCRTHNSVWLGDPDDRTPEDICEWRFCQRADAELNGEELAEVDLCQLTLALVVDLEA